MVYAEAPISGTSTNPARSLGPAVVSGQWQGWWIYAVGPLIGAIAAALACSFLAKRIEVAKLYHFDSDRGGVFRRMARRRPVLNFIKGLLEKRKCVMRSTPGSGFRN
jgi:aquaporin Z